MLFNVSSVLTVRADPMSSGPWSLFVSLSLSLGAPSGLICLHKICHSVDLPSFTKLSNPFFNKAPAHIHLVPEVNSKRHWRICLWARRHFFFSPKDSFALFVCAKIYTVNRIITLKWARYLLCIAQFVSVGFFAYLRYISNAFMQPKLKNCSVKHAEQSMQRDL